MECFGSSVKGQPRMIRDNSTEDKPKVEEMNNLSDQRERPKPGGIKAKANRSFCFILCHLPFKQRKPRRTKVNNATLAKLFEEKLQLEEEEEVNLSEVNQQRKSGNQGDKPQGVIVTADSHIPRWNRDCSALLEELMKHPAAWVFNAPGNPMGLTIPEYLGTIKSKLANNAYPGIEDFVSAIRLTFSNAMRYNHPSNDVHKMAEEMKEFFETRWKSLKEKWNQDMLRLGVWD